MIPVRRDYHFNLPADRALDWHPEGIHTSNFLNTLSVFFPVGERFFINAVRHYRSQITDPVLQKAVAGFIGQEAMHGREHEEYNNLLAAKGLPVLAQEAKVLKLLKFMAKNTSPELCLSATVALEHVTALMGNYLLENPEMMEKAPAEFRQMWMWHALEETEHKGVAYDVWQTVMAGKRHEYALRTAGLVLSNAILWPLVLQHYFQNLSALKHSVKPVKGDTRRLLKQLFGRKGVFTGQTREFLDYFGRNFHPWDHSNAKYLQKLEDFALA